MNMLKVLKLSVLLLLIFNIPVFAACPSDISGNYSMKGTQYQIAGTNPPVQTNLALWVGSYKFTKSSTATPYTGKSGVVNSFGFGALNPGGVGSNSGNGISKYYFFDRTTCTGRISDSSSNIADYAFTNAYDTFFTVENSGQTIHAVTKSSAVADPQFTPNTILIFDLTKQ